jgi:ATP phosphoribosyltransferase
LGPLVGLADRIVDLVESGRTLEENGLEIVDVIAPSSARLVVNRASYQTKRDEVGEFVDAVEARSHIDDLSADATRRLS